MSKGGFWRDALPYLAILAAVFYIPTVVSLMAPDTHMALPLLSLLLLNPAACFACSLLLGLRHGTSWIFPIVATALFVPAVFIFYNYTCLEYVPAYLACAYMGELMSFLSSRSHRKAA